MDIFLLGLTIGMANALLAAGLVLIYLSNRVVNFAHGEFGAFAVAVLFYLDQVHHLSYWLALPASLAAAAVLAITVERTIIARLFTSPRLIVLIATIGIGQLVIVARLIVSSIGATEQSTRAFGGAQVFPVPISAPTWEFGRVVLLPQHFLALTIGPLVGLGLWLFLSRSTYGVALQAAAQNAARARLLGIPVQRVSTVAWVAAALLSALGAILLAPIIGYSATEAVGLPVLVRGLAGATIARFESVGVAFGAGLAIGVADQVVFFLTGRSGLTDLVLFGVILVTVAARRGVRRRTTSGEETSWEVAEPLRTIPDRIRTHPRWRAATTGGAVTALAVLLLLPAVLKTSTTFFIASIALVAMAAVSLTVLTGWAGQLSLGQWALAGVGGVYGARLVMTGAVPFGVGLVVATALATAAAVLLGVPALRLEGVSLAAVTLAFAAAASGWLYGQPWFKSPALTPIGFLTERTYYTVAIGALALTLAGARVLQRSRPGRNMIAVRENPAQAASYGIDVVGTKLRAFALSGAVAGAAGFLWAIGIGLADSSVFTPARSLTLVTAVVIGGLGSASGAVIGVFYLLGLPYFVEGLVNPDVAQYLGLLASGVGVLVLVLFLPGGLARLVTAGRDRLATALTGEEVRPDVVPPSASPASPTEPAPPGQPIPASPPAPVPAEAGS